jgi:hypothetical protein
MNHDRISNYIPSISMLMNRICMAFNGLLRPNIVLREMSARADTAVLSWKARKCWMLWKIVFPAVNTLLGHRGRT